MLAATLTITPPAPFSELRESIRARVQQGEFPSIGWADRERNVPATPDTVYAIGSMAKAFSAMVLLRLADRGLLELDAPLRQYISQGTAIPGSANEQQATVRQALNMTAGVPHGWHYCYGSNPAERQIAEMRIAQAAQVVYRPGTRFIYSNLSYQLVSQVIAAVTGSPYRDAIRHELFDPLGMQHSAIGLSERLQQFLATGYDGNGASIPEGCELLPDGGANGFTSINDALRFGLFHLRHMPESGFQLSPHTWEAIQHEQDRNAPNATAWPETEYVSGWGIIGSGNLQSRWSNGEVLGGGSMLLLAPGVDLAVACLTNISAPGSPTEAIACAIADIVLPGYAAEIQRIRTQAEATEVARQLPVIPTIFAGQWHGSALVEGSAIPLRLSCTPPNKVTITVGEDDPARLTGISCKSDEISGGFSSTLINQKLSHRAALELALVADEQQLRGAITAQSTEALPLFGIPIPIVLQACG
jgi:CubicO group peptidase (beta-lactamase class C family)